MNVAFELDRIKFIVDRDGLDAAKVYAKELTKRYRNACKGFRTKFGTNRHPYRYTYLQSAWSARYVLRNILK